MARSRSFSTDLGIDIHVRTKIVDNWSLISNVAIRIGSDTIEITNDNTHYFNGVKDTSLPLMLAEKFEVTRNEEKFLASLDPEAPTDTMMVYTIQLEKGRVKVSNYRSMLTVDVNSYLPGTEGMLGIQTAGGMIGRDRETVLTDPNHMGAHWQVRDDEPMLFHDVEGPQYPETCVLPTADNRRRQLRHSSAVMRKVEEACSNVSISRRHFCIEDALLSGDMTIANAYKATKDSGHAL
jgi:hypothetical protein